MRLQIVKNTVLFFVSFVLSCSNNSKKSVIASKETLIEKNTSISQDLRDEKIISGANQTGSYLPMLYGKTIGIVANQTSVIFKSSTEQYTHIVDSLLQHDISIKKVFAPEHGFRGTADAGEIVKDGIDTKTGLPIISLYGNNKKPTPGQLKGIDIMIFDIQDVGARFYTYISTLHYIMEACAENNIPVLLLDRPNPNGHYIDGPILEAQHKSFVGMHPVPVVHGMTIGEYAKMINGEGWLDNSGTCELVIIPVKNYNHQMLYKLPIKPSPNLPNDTAINLYPSLCFFEGTNVSVGRGTNKQFQVIGSPFIDAPSLNYRFTPQPNQGAKYPKHENKMCNGYDLSDKERMNGINLSYLLEFYQLNKSSATNPDFFNDFFIKLAGTRTLQKQIENGVSENEIKTSWQKGLKEFKAVRSNYLLYGD